MQPNPTISQKIAMIECAQCALPIAPASVPEDGVCPGCAGSFFATPRAAGVKPVAVRPQVKPASTPAAVKGRSRLPWIAGGIVVAVVGAVIFAGPRKRTQGTPAATSGATSVPAPAPVVEKFVPLSFGAAATADTRRGVFRSVDVTTDLVHPVKTGRMILEGIPFDFADPAKSPNGKNAIAFRGGFEHSKSAYPDRVDLPGYGVAIKKLHILNAGAGWGWPWRPGKEPVPPRGEPVLHITITREDGTVEKASLQNGIAFCDHIHKQPLPGAKQLSGILSGEKFAHLSTTEFKGSGPVKSITLEGVNRNSVPILLAITAETGK